MAKSKSTVQVIPSARRLIRSLRDVGYDFVHAVADLVDNCVAANAGHITVDMRFIGEDSWLRIADNGSGMSGTVITEAMRFGTERDYKADELGKFGLGLKTASLSQCSRLTVASRTDPNSRRIEVRQWDLKHVETTNRWEIINVAADDRPEFLVEPLQNSAGTVVLWELLDRVLGYKIPWGDRARNGFFRLAEELDQHLGMVFHRFLDGEARRRKKLKITINGTNIESWDPFAREQQATIKLPGEQFEITGDDGVGLVAYSPYILPPQDRFSSLKSFNRHAGPGKWNYQQGFYIYRADRMIQSGGWSYMRTSDEHTKLARVALDFWPDLDSAFDLSVAKARVNLPADLRNKLKPHVDRLVKKARTVYSPRGNKAAGSGTAHSAGAQATGSKSGTLGATGKGGDGHASARAAAEIGSAARYSALSNGLIGEALEQAAISAGELPALRKIKEVLRSDSPEAAEKIGW